MPDIVGPVEMLFAGWLRPVCLAKVFVWSLCVVVFVSGLFCKVRRR